MRGVGDFERPHFDRGWVEVRLRDVGNTSADLTPERLACLQRLAERHGFATPPPKTFWEVACTVGAA